jgi:hypothetical protein
MPRAVTGFMWLVNRAAKERAKVREFELEAKKSRSKMVIVDTEGSKVLRYYDENDNVFAEDRLVDDDS